MQTTVSHRDLFGPAQPAPVKGARSARRCKDGSTEHAWSSEWSGRKLTGWKCIRCTAKAAA